MESLLMLLALAVLAAPVLLIKALVGLSSLKGRVGELENEVRWLRSQLPPMQAGQAATSKTTQERAVAVAPAPTVASSIPAAAAAPVPSVTPAMPAALTGHEVRPGVAHPAMPTGTAVPVPPVASAISATSAEQAVIPEVARAPSSPPRRLDEAMPSSAPPAPGSDESLVAVIRRWFTEGNVPVKVGVLVLLTGVGALLKYAGDQGWLTLPISVRLMAISLVAFGALVFAWKKRESHRSFALAVQGGAIGVLLLVVFAAFKLYGLLPVAMAFALSVSLVAALGILALLQDSRTLAVLGILAGFLAPLWLSTGAGNHVVLFSYYALLNAAIFALAWLRPWRELNLLGWVFTWGIGLAWGVRSYEPAKYATTQPFLLLFFVLYLLIPILYARRQAPGRRDIVNGSLVFGTPLVAFTAQAALLEGERMPLALCALALSGIYAALWGWQRRGPHPRLGDAYVLLAAGFATLSVPLALSAQATAAVFTVEGAALVWLGLRQERQLPRWAGAGLQLAAAVAFLIGPTVLRRPGPILANPVFAGALLLALAGLACAWWYRGARRSPVAIAYYCWGLAWWLGNALYEVNAHVASEWRPDVLLAVLSVTSLLAAEAQKRAAMRLTTPLTLTVLGAFVLAAPVALAQVHLRGQPFEGWGAAAWLLFAACGARSLVSLRNDGGLAAAGTQFTWWLLWPLVFSLAAWDVAHVLALGSGWRMALPGVPLLGMLALLQFRWHWLRQPLGERFDASRQALLAIFLLVLGFGWGLALGDPGDSAPLLWLPVLNPLDLAQLAALALSASALWSPLASPELARRRMALVSAAGFVLVTCITLRAVHHLGDVPWGGSLWSESVAQTTLTIVWSVLGVTGWIVGSRRGQRALWLTGAVLMAVVLAKLVLVDRQHLGDLLGIGSFLAYGLLCTLVGWFAPAPPRAGGEAEDVAGA